jgi:hypothetical protein
MRLTIVALFLTFLMSMTVSDVSAQTQRPPAQSEQAPVKKSNTGICHAPGTTYYVQTKSFTPFRTLDECLKSGGRLPKR